MLDKETANLVAELNAASHDIHTEELSMAAAREGAKAMFVGFAGPAPETGVEVSNWHLPNKGVVVPVRSYRPSGYENKSLPCVMFFHGGGWSLGDLDCYDSLLRDLCARSGLLFVSVDYRLAPEHPYPAGLEDCLAAVRWCHTHSGEIGANPDCMALMGDSAGGNLAVAAAHHLASDSQLALRSLHLIYPVLDVCSAHEVYPSRVKFGDGDYLLSRDAIANTGDYYCTHPSQLKQDDISPLQLSSVMHLPPTSLLVAGYDPLHDEGAQFAERLLKAGRLRDYTCVESSIHAFFSFGILPVAMRARQLVATQLRNALVDEAQAVVSLIR